MKTKQTKHDEVKIEQLVEEYESEKFRGLDIEESDRSVGIMGNTFILVFDADKESVEWKGKGKSKKWTTKHKKCELSVAMGDEDFDRLCERLEPIILNRNNERRTE